MLKFRITHTYLVVIAALYFTLVLNYPFLARVYETITQLETVHWLFTLSVPVWLFSLLLFLFNILTIKHIAKPVLIALVITSSLVFYGALAYGTAFDYGMIENIFETDSSEAFSYMSPNFLIVFFLTGLLPALLLARSKIVYRKSMKQLGAHLLLAIISLTIFAGTTFTFYKDYAAVGRNNRIVKRYIIPTQYLDSSYKYLRNTYFTEPMQYKTLGTDASLSQRGGKPIVTVMLVGETARAANYQYNGYPRATNHWTKNQTSLLYSTATSCGTATAVSVPCMFSFQTIDQYDKQEAAHQDNVLDVIQRAGTDVVWIDNDSGCKGVCGHVKTVQIETNPSALCDGEYCFDEVMLPYLQSLLQAPRDKDLLIVLHLIGSHGPTYYRRYPEAHKMFQPDCARSDIQNCTEDQIRNSYDNTIAYTDYITSRVIAQLKAEESRFDTALVYMSDHGESLGENGMYLHGAPYAFAPDEQTTVPAILWFSDSYLKDQSMDKGCIQAHLDGGKVSHNNLSHTLLGVMGVNTSLRQPALNLITGCQHLTTAASAPLSEPAEQHIL